MKIFAPTSKDELPQVCLLHEKPEHNCLSCVWWLLRSNEKKKLAVAELGKVKDMYMQKASEGSFGYLLAKEGGRTVGLIQYGPKREYRYLEDLKKGSTESDKWIVVCLQSSNNDQMVKEELLHEMIRSIRRTHPEVQNILGSVLRNSSIKKASSAGSAEPFIKVGFKKVSDIDEYFILVEYTF